MSDLYKTQDLIDWIDSSPSKSMDDKNFLFNQFAENYDEIRSAAKDTNDMWKLKYLVGDEEVKHWITGYSQDKYAGFESVTAQFSN